LLRDMIREAIIDYGIPIGSSIRGYYLISTDFESYQNDMQLGFRQQGIQNRRDAAMEGWAKRKARMEAGENWPKKEKLAWSLADPYNIVALLTEGAFSEDVS